MALLGGRLAVASGTLLVVEADGELPVAVKGDSGRIRQVIANFLTNAVKFTERGEISLRAHLVRQTGDVAQVRVEVKDTGIGLTPAAAARLFQAFVQADASALPRAPEPVDLRGRRALLVDDNETNRRVLGLQLAQWGLKVTEADSGAAALALVAEAAARNEPFELLLLDMQMPEMDGLEVARRVRANPAFAGLKMVMLTSVALRQVATTAQEIGIAACLTKPVRATQLQEKRSLVLGEAARPVEPLGALLPFPNAAAAAKTLEGRAARVLVVEDNAVNQKVAVKFLAKLGYVADVAANGLEALTLCARAPYDLILMDCQMPEMDGAPPSSSGPLRRGSPPRTRAREPPAPAAG